MMKKINSRYKVYIDMREQFLLILVSLFLSITATAQSFWRQPMDTVSSSGYYNIELSQEMAGLGLQTLRVFDQNNKEVPYLIRSSVPVKEMKDMEMYELLLNTQRDSINTIIVHNNGDAVSRFYLQMKEAEVIKYITMRGSYDRKQWFSVKQRSLLKSERNPNLGEVAIVDFPKGDYTYYELTITNNSQSPLNITGVGKIEKSNIYGQFVELNPGAFNIEEKDGNTVVTFPLMQYPYYLSKLEFQVSGKGHYSRKVHIEKKGYSKHSFQLSSREEPLFYLDDFLIDKDMRLVIENGNNPPLTIQDVKLFGLSRYLCAYLDSGIHYRIETSAERHRHYDIQDFADEIPLNLPVVRTGNLEVIESIVEPERTPNFFETPLFLWGVIVLTGIGLLLICMKMLKELKSRK